jgi:G3E family GTPase
MLPLTLITGFLGAGKTTFLSRLLEHRAAAEGEGRYASKRLAVVVNEFAELGLDGVRLPGGDYEKWELNRGSIFCVYMRTDFIVLMEKIVNDIDPDEIWVEATGIADVSEIFKMISVPTLRDKLYLRTNVCLVDPGSILKILTTLRAAQEQVRLADMLIINKIDTADEDALNNIETELRIRNTVAPIIRADHAVCDLSLIPGIDVPRFENPEGSDHQPQPVYSVSVTEQWIISSEQFRHWYERQGNNVWRVKGRLMTPDGPVWMEGTLSSLTFTVCPAACTVPAATSLALIGPGLEKEQVLRELEDLTGARQP